MLWEVRASRCAPRFLGGRATVASQVVALGTGADAVVGATSASTGLFNLPLRGIDLGAIPTVVATNDGAVLSGNVGAYANGAQDAQTLKLACRNAGSVADGALQFLALGYDSGDYNLLMPQANIVKASWCDPLLFVAKVTGATGVVAAGGNTIACTRTGTGAYTLTFQNCTIGSNVIGGVTPISATKSEASIKTCTAQGCLVITTQAGSAADVDFYVWIHATQKTDPLHAKWAPLLCNLRNPQMYAIEYNLSTSAFVKGTGEFTAVKNGTGDVTFTFTSRFVPAKAPIILAGTQALGSAQVVATATTASFQVKSYNGTGSALDTTVHVLVIAGFQGTDEF